MATLWLRVYQLLSVAGFTGRCEKEEERVVTIREMAHGSVRRTGDVTITDYDS